MSRFYENHFKKLSLLIVMLLMGLSAAFAQQTELRLVIECEGIVLVRDANTQQAVASIQGPTAPGDYALVNLAANQLIQLVTDPFGLVPPLPQFQIQGVEVMWWEYTNNHTPPTPPVWTVQNPATTQNLALQMGATGTIRIVQVRFKVKDPGITISDPGDISTITSTPVIIPLTVNYQSYSIPNEYTNSGIRVDATIEHAFGGNFPAGAQIIKVSLDGGVTNLLGAAVPIGGLPMVYLSEVLGITPALLEDELGKTLNWEITVAGVTAPVTVPVKVTSIGYKVVDPLTQSFPGPFYISGLNVNCITEFANPSEFNVTWADSEVVAIDDFAVCYDDESCFDFDYEMTYPDIVNLDERVKNDAKITLYKSASKSDFWPVNAGATIELLVNGFSIGVANIVTPTYEFYLTDFISNDEELVDFSGGTYTYTLSICGANPGNYYFEVENFAYIEDNYPLPLVEYVYDGDEFLVQYVGALDVDIDPIADIQTVNLTPVIVPVTVTYPDLYAQNIDPAVLTDAKISTPLVGGFPNDAKIIKITYEGGIAYSGNYSIAGLNDFYLSDILGGANPLLGHSGLELDWEFYLAGVDYVGTVSITVEGLAYLNKLQCHSILDSESFTIEYGVVTSTLEFVEPVCEDEDVVINLSYDYPEISNLDLRILEDMKVSFSPVLSTTNAINAVLTFLENGVQVNPPIPVVIPANTNYFYASAILGVDKPLQNFDDLDLDIQLVLGPGIDYGVYSMTFELLAELDGVEYYHNFDGGTFEIKEPVVALAGDDQIVCNSVDTNLDGNILNVNGSLGYWTKTGGPGTAIFDDPTNPKTKVTVDVAGTYTFTWNVWNGGTFDPFEPVCFDSDDVVVTFLKGTIADAYYFDEVADIDAVMGAPIVTKYTYNLPVPDVDADPNIIMDGLIHVEGGFPDNAVITGIARTATITTTWFPVVNGNVGGDEYVLFSDLIGGTNELFDNVLPFYNWVISYAGFDEVGVYTTTISLITYIDKPVNFATDCYATLDSESYIISVDEATITTPLECLVECYDAEEQLHEFDFDIEIAYPAINNVDVNDQITLDALLTITNGNLLSGATLYWGYNAPATNASAIDVNGLSSVYLSQIVGGSPTPISGHNGLTDVWNIRIVGLDPGNYDFMVEAIALIDLYNDFIPNSSTGISFPLINYGTDFTRTAYSYAENTFCLKVVGALGVTAEIDADYIETVTGAPVVFDVTVAYGDLASQNIDPAVMVDALIEFGTPLPVGAYLVELLYNGNPVGIVTPTLIADTYQVLLSDIIGPPSPFALNGHTGLTDVWTITIAGVNAPGTYTATFSSIAYIDYDVCYSVLAEDDITVTWDDLSFETGDPDPVCVGDIIESGVWLGYPNISGNPDDITTDALLTVDNPFPVGVEITWTYNGGPSGVYTVATPLSAIRLSELILGSVPAGIAPTPLNGHNALYVDWGFEFEGLPAGIYNLTFVPVATLNGVDYTLYNSPINQMLWVFPYPDFEIDGDEDVFSGSTTEYEIVDNTIHVVNNDFTGPFAVGNWNTSFPEPEFGGAVTHTLTTLAIAGPDGDPCGQLGGREVEVSIYIPCGGEVSFNYDWSSIDGGYWDVFLVGETGTVSPILSLDNEQQGTGNVTFTVNAGETLYFVVFSVDCIAGAGYATITNFQFTFDELFYNWTISNVAEEGYNDQWLYGDPVFVTTTDGPEVEVFVEYPFTGTYDLNLEVWNCAGCVSSETLTVTVHPNQLVGQVKYYNPLESPMPSPFNVNYNGMTIPDYFYVSLVATNTFTFGIDDIYAGAIESNKVEEYYGENGHPLLTDDVYEAAFAFDFNLDPNEEYYVIVWDGGLYAEYPSLGGFANLGQTWTWNEWGGVNATDALLIQHMVAGNINSGLPGEILLNYLPAAPYTDSYAKEVADVNNSTTLSALDALLTARRAVGLIQKFPNEKPNFAVAGHFVSDVEFNTPAVFGNVLPGVDFDYIPASNYIWSSFAFEHPYATQQVFGLGNQYLNVYYDAVGDINASYIPAYGGFKIAPAMELIYEDVLAVNKGDIITVPVTIDRSTDLGALSIGLTYRTDLIEVIGTNYGEDFAYFNHETGTVRIAWSSLDGISFNAGDVVAEITVRVLADLDESVRLFELESFTELADLNAKVIEGVNFKSQSLSTKLPTASNDFTAANYPNPFREESTITYTMPEAGAVNLVIYNKMGQIVKTVVNAYQDAGVHNVVVTSSDLNGPGIYYYILEVKGGSSDFSSTNSMILIR